MTEWRYMRGLRRALQPLRAAPRTRSWRPQRDAEPAVLVETARLAAQSLGAAVFDVVVPTPASTHPVPIRSTGASQAIAGNRGGHRRAAHRPTS